MGAAGETGRPRPAIGLKGEATLCVGCTRPLVSKTGSCRPAARLVWTVSIELASELIDCHGCWPFLRHGHGPQAHRSARRGKWREQRDVGGLSDCTRSASKSHSKRTRRRKSGGTQAGSGIAMARHGLVDGCGVMARVAGSSDQQPSGPDVGPRAYPCILPARTASGRTE